MKLLLKADVNVNAASEDGTTALLLATLSGQVEMVQILLEAGANRNAANSYGLTPLLASLEVNNVTNLSGLPPLPEAYSPPEYNN